MSPLVEHYAQLMTKNLDDWRNRSFVAAIKESRETRQLALAEQARHDSLDHTGMTLDQLKAEHHVVSQRLARGIYRDDTKADLEGRQDKLLLSIKRKERHA